MNTETYLQRWERHSEWPLAAAAVLFLGVFSMEVLAEPQGHQAHVLWLVSWTTWGLFIVDYVARLCLASERGRWFLHHLLDFAIVALPLLRPLRLLRLIVLITVLQKAVGDAFRGRIVVYTVSGVLLLIYTASLAVFDKERYQHGATINSFGKALWWSITTVTTVGYGRRLPGYQHRPSYCRAADDRRDQSRRSCHSSPRVVDHPECGGRRDRESGGNCRPCR